MSAKGLKKLGYWIAAWILLIGSAKYALDYESENRGQTPGTCKEAPYIFKGRDYTISNCTMGGFDNYNLYRLRIYSKNRTLLAERFYRNIYDGGWNIDAKGGVAYWTEDELGQIWHPEGSTGSYIQLPPTWLDWIRARLP